MKKILLVVALIATIFTKSIFAQGSQKSLLGSYYAVKNALVESNSELANSTAVEFSTALSSVDDKSFTATEKSAFKSLKDKLAFDAKHIGESKDIAHQREHFANFSVNFYKLAKAIKLTDKPVYYAYCPMKKSYWLSDAEAIKNPYYGKQMLTCGSVKETLK